ncbi:uncharacterized protein FOMMEDRAFT_151455 [Fomitiporia mediterranea MF3/22]|uniref:uncharacterized protein n=1 Tax=Fomitiporia mediterranea (strain MF3/22) TaxID=694068 RepID=UPI0004408407|nr:uncharacterized protein FOMMEDRAFT_151455 [Fomitiporia mediterranea MF3/22]EJD08576.1 hypothetical protein FOMMEDRAFT_151455 [Fomitiporia mediterranea MF3/22]
MYHHSQGAILSPTPRPLSFSTHSMFDIILDGLTLRAFTFPSAVHDTISNGSIRINSFNTPDLNLHAPLTLAARCRGEASTSTTCSTSQVTRIHNSTLQGLGDDQGANEAEAAGGVGIGAVEIITYYSLDGHLYVVDDVNDLSLVQAVTGRASTSGDYKHEFFRNDPEIGTIEDIWTCSLCKGPRYRTPIAYKTLHRWLTHKLRCPLIQDKLCNELAALEANTKKPKTKPNSQCGAHGGNSYWSDQSTPNLLQGMQQVGQETVERTRRVPWPLSGIVKPETQGRVIKKQP